MPPTARAKKSGTPVAVQPAEGSSLPPHVEALLAEPVAPLEKFLARTLESFELPGNLREAVRYSLLGGGKRLRPVLAWYASIACGGDGPRSIPSGAAVELVHAFSLVHDDLPAMDDDDMRRGRPTLHKATSEAMAILAGDAMLTFAFQVLLERSPTPALAARLCHELAIGTTGMIAGQVYDTLGGFENGIDDESRLRLVHRNKTGALLRASCRMGAIAALGEAAGDADGRLSAITRYAETIGLMFQVVDDLLDVTQSAAHIGKATNKDQEAGKLTYPGVLGVERSRAIVKELHEASEAALAPLGASADPLRALAAYMAVRTK